MFLSPPWGGIEYKDENVYSMKTMITPDIYQTIKTSLNIANKLIFYLPRNIILDEFFEILDSCLQDINNKANVRKDDKKLDYDVNNDIGEYNVIDNGNDNVANLNEIVFLDIQMLKSANKVKAILITCELNMKKSKDLNDLNDRNDLNELVGDKNDKENCSIKYKELRKYVRSIYSKAEDYQICQLMNFTKVMGVLKFIKAEHIFRTTTHNEVNDKAQIHKLLKFIKEEVADTKECEKLKKVDKKTKKKEKKTKIDLKYIKPTHVIFGEDGEIIENLNENVNVENGENSEKVINGNESKNVIEKKNKKNLKHIKPTHIIFEDDGEIIENLNENVGDEKDVGKENDNENENENDIFEDKKNMKDIEFIKSVKRSNKGNKINKGNNSNKGNKVMSGMMFMTEDEYNFLVNKSV